MLYLVLVVVSNEERGNKWRWVLRPLLPNTLADWRLATFVFLGLSPSLGAILLGLPSKVRVSSSISGDPTVSLRNCRYDCLRAALNAWPAR